MDRITFDIPAKELNQAIENVKAYERAKKQQIQEQVARSALNIEQDTKQSTPVDTGRLRASYTIVFRFDKMGAEVGSNVEYAPYVEFGTGAMVDVPEGLESYALQFKGKGIKQVNLPARPHLYPAYEKERPKFIKALSDLLGKPR